MKTRYELAINGTQLHVLSDRIMILDISHGTARTEVVSNNIPNRNGQRVAGRYVRSVSVTVTFEIHTPDIEERQRVMDSIVSLASEAEYITTNDKPEKVLYAVCDTLPAIDSVLKWTKPIKMTFTAYDVPYWQSEYPVGVEIEGRSGEDTMYVDGNGALARVSVSVQNATQGTLNDVTVGVGDTKIALTGLSLYPGEELEIGHENGLLYIRGASGSKMKCRTAESSDELLIKTGTRQTVFVQAGGNVRASFSARGLF